MYVAKIILQRVKKCIVIHIIHLLVNIFLQYKCNFVE